MEDKYQYNGIELNTDFGLLVNEARFRTLDPQLGRWWQIDPEVEQFEAWSPYNSNLDNPILNSDPDGDICIPCLTALGGAIIGGGVELGGQLIANGGDIREVDFVDVSVETFNGFVKGSGVGTVFSGVTETVGVGVKATFDLSIKNGNENYFNGGKSGAEVVFDAGADVVMGKVLNGAGESIVKKSNTAVKQTEKAYSKSGKELTKTQNSYNKTTNGGKNMNANGSGIASVKLNAAKAKSQHSYTQKKVAQGTNALVKSKAGNVTKEVIDNKTTQYVKQKIGLAKDE